MIKIVWYTEDGKQFMGKIEETFFHGRIMPLFVGNLKPLTPQEYTIIPQNKQEIKQDVKQDMTNEITHQQKKKWWKL